MYNTRQKTMLLDYLKKNKLKQFSSNDIITELCKDGKGKSTIYRLMSQMIDEGVIVRMSGNDAKNVLYQYTGTDSKCRDHFHLKCTSCGRLIHLDCDELTKIKEHISNSHNFEINSIKTVFYGICSECKNYEVENK